MALTELLAAVTMGFQVSAEKPHVVDFGPDAEAGYPVVEIASVTGTGAVLRVSYATHPDGLGPKGDFWHETRATYLGDGVNLPIAPASTDRFDLFAVTNAGVFHARLQQGLVRYVKFAVDTPGAAVDVAAFRLDNRATYSTEPVVGSFDCSDARLTKLWRASVRTCRLAAIPKRGAETTWAYLSDGAKRDRLVWSGDLWWADLNMYYAFASDSPYMPGSIRMLAASQTPEGYVWACPYPETRLPPKSGEYGPFESDEFAAWLIPVARNHALYTGDLSTLDAVWPNLLKLADYLSQYVGSDGVFVQRPETSKNAGALRFGAESTQRRFYMNVLLWKCWRDLAEMASWQGGVRLSRAFADRARRTSEVVRRNFRADDGTFVRAVENRSFDPEGSALALACGFLDEEETRAALVRLTVIGHAKFQALVVRGAFGAGDGDRAYAAIAGHNWFRVLEPDWKGCRTTYECMHLHTSGWGDECHPDTALAGALSQGILGVRPVGLGWKEFVFEPHPPKGVTWAKGAVPTPAGLLRVEWVRAEDGTIRERIHAPDGIVRVSSEGR